MWLQWLWDIYNYESFLYIIRKDYKNNLIVLLLQTKS